MRKAKRKNKRKKDRMKEQRKKKEKWRKKKRESESKVVTSGSLGVCLITEMPLKIKLWKLKTLKMCF